MKKHVSSVHDRKMPFKFNDCGTSYPQKGNLNKHVKSVHEGKKPFKCNYCDLAFAYKR